MRQTVGPVGEFLVSAAAAVADQRHVIAEAPRDHLVGKFDRGVQLGAIVEIREVDVRPCVLWRQVIAGETVSMCRSMHALAPL